MKSCFMLRRPGFFFESIKLLSDLAVYWTEFAQMKMTLPPIVSTALINFIIRARPLDAA